MTGAGHDTTKQGSACGRFVSWWEGEYEGNCELAEGHDGPHFDGMSWYDEDGIEVSDASAERPKEKP